MTGMPEPVIGPVVNLLGFLTGAALYVMLVALVWRERTRERTPFLSAPSALPLLTGVCGVVWNVGALRSFGLASLGVGQPWPIEVAIAFSALGFLPAVVVHSLLESRERSAARWARDLGVVAAYGLSGCAALMQLLAAASGEAVPSRAALWLLTIGFTSLIGLLLAGTRRQPVGRSGIWVAALSIFAVSALHFVRHEGNESWLVELVGHQASLPLALAILHQDYRFAFADLFLKNAIALLLLMALTLGWFSGIVVPILHAEGQGETPIMLVSVALSMATAVCFPLLQRAANWLVDRAVLRRPNYEELLAGFGSDVAQAQSDERVLEIVEAGIASAFGATAARVDVTAVDETHAPPVVVGADIRQWIHVPAAAALLRLQTVDPPQPALVVGALAGGRRLLSDDVRLLEEVSRIASRRIDSIRVSQERMVRSLEEQEMHQLLTEAELRALCAQLHPHFLFNALTTIGHLIQTAPSRALETLLKLTGVLRGVLQRANADSSTLGDEIDLVTAYLDVERARYEERLRVAIDVAPTLRDAVVPSLLLQPLVENAVRHGIAPIRGGGQVTIRAMRTEARLRIAVEDTGVGFDPSSTAPDGVGLTNARRRLEVRYGSAASLTLSSTKGAGTLALIELPWSTGVSVVARLPKAVAR
jgi:two-component system, LytTR family, sensor kinase